MRRITLWLFSTVAALVLLFSYRTSTAGAGGGTALVAAAPEGSGTDGATSGNQGATGATDSATPDSASGSDTSGSGSGSGSSGSSSSGSGSTGSGSSGSGQGDAVTSGNKTYSGSVVQTRWGPIQVTISVSGGKITDVAVPTYPSGNHRDEEINAYALPALRQATMSAQSADIDTVSGATVTSDGYRQSLQSALDAARL
ncbi:FMN-binding protein [Krasilnikovia sp. MM14-A1004]|uniref:FMN-binding protein n=1 Tax=Krasilnikovia sp. MM14-A1004 TaxID=3373541 RepID=UPI00399CB8EC